MKASSATYVTRFVIADSVDTCLASLLYSWTADAVFSELHDQ